MADATHADSAHIKPVAPAAEDSPVPLAAAVSSADAFRRFWPWARPDRYRLAASVKAPEQVEEELDPATVPDPRQALALLDEVGKVLPHAVVRSSWPIGSALAAVRAI